MSDGFFSRLSAALARAAGVPSTVTREVRGLTVMVTNTRPDISTEHVFERVAATLDVVARYQPVRYRHLMRDIRRIVVQRFPCRAAYFAESGACLLELTFVVNPEFSLSQVAASLVHEGMHARVHRSGACVTPQQKPREERLCRRAELELGLAVPDGAPVVERALASLALEDEEVAPAIDWTEAARRVDAVDAADAEARRRGS